MEKAAGSANQPFCFLRTYTKKARKPVASAVLTQTLLEPRKIYRPVSASGSFILSFFSAVIVMERLSLRIDLCTISIACTSKFIRQLATIEKNKSTRKVERYNFCEFFPSGN